MGIGGWLGRNGDHLSPKYPGLRICSTPFLTIKEFSSYQYLHFHDSENGLKTVLLNTFQNLP